jgi:uncharacterized cupredoxin-like copper-binding protein
MVRINPAGSWVKFILIQMLALLGSSYALGESPQSHSSRSEADETVNVTLQEWYVLHDKKTVTAGDITFIVTNRGRKDHEFIIIKTPLPIDALPVTEKGLIEKKAGKMIGEIEDIHPGEIKEITLDMSPGSYVLFCNRIETDDHKIISHYRQGMRIAFTVR